MISLERYERMNLPNKLTVLRVMMIPFFVAAMLLSTGDTAAEAYLRGDLKLYYVLRITACVIFLMASFTDYLDGHIARKRGIVTNFGKFMDPLADKLLVCSALILLSAEGSLHPLITLIIVAREFIISGFRLVAADRGVVIAASKWGKLKTVTQMLMCVLLILKLPLFFIGSDAGFGLSLIFMYVVEALAVILTIVSLIDYIAKNISIITEGGM